MRFDGGGRRGRWIWKENERDWGGGCRCKVNGERINKTRAGRYLEFSFVSRIS